MYQIIMMIHVFAAVCIIALVLVQQGKGAGMGAAFGSGASSTVFGSRGSGSFLFRLTIGFIAIFFIASLAMNYMTVRAYKQPQAMTLVPNAPQTNQAAPEVPTAATPEQIPVTHTNGHEKAGKNGKNSKK